MKLTCALALLFLAGLGQMPAATDEGPKTIPELRAAIEAVLKDTRTPGVGVAIVRRTGPEWVDGIGLSDVAAGTAATADTLFRVGSISKGFVALSVLKLQQEGRLNLQDTLRSRAPVLAFENPWEETNPVRLVDLLEHTAGWDDLTLKDHNFLAPDDIPLQAILAYDRKPLVSAWKPGTAYRYANHGPVAAAYVVEKITGQRFEDYVGQTWFRPLEMDAASYFPTPAVERRLTKLYLADGVTPAPYRQILVRPSGALNASAREMANYLQLLLNRGAFKGTQLITPECIDRMETPSRTLAAREGLTTGYGLGTQRMVRGNRTFQGHFGSVVNGHAEIAYLPQDGVGFVFMTNSGDWAAVDRIESLLRTYITRDLPTPSAPAVAEVPAALLASYAGWYEPTCPPNQAVAGFWRLMLLTELRPGQNGLGLRNFIGPVRAFIDYTAVTDRLYRRPWENAPTLALLAEKAEGTQIQVSVYDSLHTFRRVPTALVWVELTVILAFFLSLLSSLAFALVWVPRKLFGRMKTVEGLGVLLLPLLAALSFLATAYAYAAAQADAIGRLGRITSWSLAVFVLGLAFALCAVGGLVLALRSRTRPIHRGVWWHSFLASLLFTVVTLYLAYWGYIGWRTWA